MIALLVVVCILYGLVEMRVYASTSMFMDSRLRAEALFDYQGVHFAAIATDASYNYHHHGSVDKKHTQSLIDVQLEIKSELPQHLSQWSTDTSCAYIHIRSLSSNTMAVVLRMVLYKDSTVVAYTRASDGSILNVGQLAVALCLRDVFPEKATEYMSSLTGAVTRRGTLRPGVYSLQCQILNADNTDDIVAQSNVVSCVVKGFAAPSLVEPPTYHWISLTKDVVFRWKALESLPVLPHTVRYKFVLFDVPEGTDPDDIEERRKPCMQVLSSTDAPLQLRLMPKSVPLRAGGTYVWSVHAIDESGTPYGKNGGYAESFVFRVRK